MKLLFVTLTFMLVLAIATVLSFELGVLAMEHGAPQVFTIIMAAITGLLGYLTVVLPPTFYNAHRK